jgi:S-DNA-T family DNA segregation ATPase FtsK/SpoIIIE
MFKVIHGEKAPDLANVGVRRVGGTLVREPVVTIPRWWLVLRWLLSPVSRLLAVCLRHPVPAGLVVSTVALYGYVGERAFVGGALVLAVLLVVWRIAHRGTFDKLVWLPLLALWRGWWIYKRHWHATMAVTGLAVVYQDTEYVPAIVRVRCGPYVDRVTVDMVSGQAPEQWQRVSSALAHTFGAITLRVRVVRPRRIALECTRSDSLVEPVAPMPIGPDSPVDLAALPVGVQEDGTLWLLRLFGTHVLVVGASNAGKGSVVWSLLRALGPAIRAGLVAPWVLDPKGGMELAAGARMFARFEADSYEAMATLLEDAVGIMDDRSRRLRGVTRQHTATVDDPLILVVVDEMANLTAYLPDAGLRKRISAALSLLLSKGRAVGVHVVAALQDPRKDVLPFRNLFPTRIALRLTESTEVDMVLGDGMRDRGALCDLIPVELPGVGYVALSGVPEPIRVRASNITDDDIDAMAELFRSPHAVGFVEDDEPSVTVLVPAQREGQ